MKNNIILLLFVIGSFVSKAQDGCDYVSYSDGQYASVNGIRLYYKTFGSGTETVVLLHNAYRTMESMCSQIDAFSKSYRVIAIDTRGHGRSTDDEKPYSYSLFASDVDALLAQLGIGKALVVGTGDGANTAIQLAISFPERVGKLVVAGANLTADSKAVSDNILQSVRKASASTIDSVVVGFYTRYSNNPKNFPVYFEKMKKLLLNHPNLTSNDLKTIKAPALVISGDKDFILLENTLKIYRGIAGSSLLIVPNAGHYVMQQKPDFVNSQISDFLAGK